MRILLLTQYFPPEIGAAQVRLGAIVAAWRRQGIAVEVVTAMPNYPEGRIAPGYRGRLYVCEREPGLVVHRVWLYAAMGKSWRRLLNYFSFMLTAFMALLRTSRADVVFVESPPPILSPLAWLLKVLRGQPYVVNVADVWPDALELAGVHLPKLAWLLVRGMERYFFKRALAVTTVSDGCAKTLLEDRGVQPDRLWMLPNGADTSLFKPGPPDQQKRQELGVGTGPIFVYAGAMGYAHGLDTVLDACKILAKQLPDAVCLLIGDGSERARLQVRAQVEAIGNLRFLPPCSPQELARVYTLATAGIVCLRDTPAMRGVRSAKLFPMLAAGLPVVHSGAGEGALLVQNHGLGLVTPAGDAQALADGLCRMVAEPVWAKELGAKARQFVVTHYSWDALVATWLERLQQALKSERQC